MFEMSFLGSPHQRRTDVGQVVGVCSGLEQHWYWRVHYEQHKSMHCIRT